MVWIINLIRLLRFQFVIYSLIDVRQIDFSGNVAVCAFDLKFGPVYSCAWVLTLCIAGDGNER